MARSPTPPQCPSIAGVKSARILPIRQQGATGESAPSCVSTRNGARRPDRMRPSTQRGRGCCPRRSGPRSDVVSAMMRLLMAQDRGYEGSAPEMARQQLLAGVCAARGEHPDLEEAMPIILVYERCYHLASLAFQRLALDYPTSHRPAGWATSDRASDEVLQTCAEELPLGSSPESARALEHHRTCDCLGRLGQLEDVPAFLKEGGRLRRRRCARRCLLETPPGKSLDTAKRQLVSVRGGVSLTVRRN